MKIIDNTPIENFDTDWGDPDGTGMKEKSKEQVQKFIKGSIKRIEEDAADLKKDNESFKKNVDNQIANQSNEIAVFKKDVTNQIENYKPIEINGNVNNAADEEDLTAENGLIKIANRGTLYGKGYKILRRGVDLQSQFNQENTIYEIRYDFDLGGGTLNIPAGCTLKFEGGSFANGVLNCNSTYISGKIDCLTDITKIQGRIISTINLSWIGIYGDNPYNSSRIKNLGKIPATSVKVDSPITFNEGDIILPSNITIDGNNYWLSFTCSTCEHGLICLSDRVVLENIKITVPPSNLDFDKPVILADTRISNPHVFRLSNILVDSYNSTGKAKDTGLKIIASNDKENSKQNYITGCHITNCRFENFKIGIEVDCINKEYTSGEKNYSWLNNIYFDNLYVSAEEYGILTNYEDNAVYNPSNSCGPIFIHNYLFQAQDKDNAMSFSHSGNWELYIDSGRHYDSNYKGVVHSGTVMADFFHGGYEYKDSVGNNDDEGTFNVVDSVKVYKGSYSVNSNQLKTYDTFRCLYSRLSGSGVWGVGCNINNNSFEISDGLSLGISTVRKNYWNKVNLHIERNIINGAPIFTQYKKDQSSYGGVFKTVIGYNNTNGSYELFSFNRNPNFPTTIQAVNQQGMDEIYSLTDIYRKYVAGKRYSGKIKLLFKVDNSEVNYAQYTASYGRLNINQHPALTVNIMTIDKAYYSKEGDDLYIVWEGVSLSTTETRCVYTFSVGYKRSLSVNKDYTFENSDCLVLNISHEWFICNAQIVAIDEITPIGAISFVDNKPIWYNGTEWVDANGEVVSGTSI